MARIGQFVELNRGMRKFQGIIVERLDPADNKGRVFKVLGFPLENHWYVGEFEEEKLKIVPLEDQSKDQHDFRIRINREINIERIS